ncbi:MAG: YceI family protein [Thermoanaerobaculia bacterium]|nr:YceI family protein [Thermoanaerobaculia bacterium]
MKTQPTFAPTIRRTASWTILWLAATFVALSSASAADQVLSVDGAASSVRFTLGATGHTVEGELFLENGEVQFDPATGAASGTLRVDARRAVTHNAKRDTKMHETVLESERHRWIEFELQGVTGTLPSAEDSKPATLRLRGIMNLLGKNHPMTLPIEVTRRQESVTVTAAFTVPYVDWGLHDPSVFVLRVAKEVEVEVGLMGRLVANSEPDSP